MKFDQLAKSIVEKYDAWDEADEYYGLVDGRMKIRSYKHAVMGRAWKDGFYPSVQEALKRAGIVKSKYDPNKYIQKMGDKWVQVFPFGKPDQTPEGAPSTPPAQ